MYICVLLEQNYINVHLFMHLLTEIVNQHEMLDHPIPNNIVKNTQKIQTYYFSCTQKKIL